MAFSYAVIRQDLDGWHVGVNDYTRTREVNEVKTLDAALQHLRRMIQEAQDETRRDG